VWQQNEKHCGPTGTVGTTFGTQDQASRENYTVVPIKNSRAISISGTASSFQIKQMQMHGVGLSMCFFPISEKIRPRIVQMAQDRRSDRAHAPFFYNSAELGEEIKSNTEL